LAFNFNGAGALSSEAVFKSCTAPSGQSAPQLISVDQTSIELQWSPPLNDGGCPILSYEVYFDNGAGGSFI